ncbi:MAG: hypothetical protein A2928_03695 [Candidatus Taylorbacteria bacterium RIFCSPLOWO2_01_FULL_45_15b]|uniref:Uncharacterized protein n=1 Tax=Candidatus Taylorbacteria bacterium RIFCSPLOWO2_01_FULL_45_15b TaxID=1802319 RepID=A0A1G2NF44_9BACT|nr:MAG: hypothetical protein A2928_03695 [Candidatus Taylorbacteria bacterium RIFCSPLOWO2_01_FULL_45_15b]
MYDRLINVKSLSIKENAIKLRKEGFSYGLIKEKTGVSKSTLSNWLCELDYLPNQITIEKIGKARAASTAAKQKLKFASIQEAHRLAEKDIGDLRKRDIFMLGLGLYISEGTKSSSDIRIINSNSEIINLAIRWFRDVIGIPLHNFRMRLHLYPDNNVEDSIRFWSTTTKIPIVQFQKTQIDRRKNKKISKKGKLPFGTAHLSVRSGGSKNHGVFLARKIDGWMKIALKNKLFTE